MPSTSPGPGELNKMINLFKNVIRHLLVEHVPDHLLKTQEMCNKIMRTMPYAFHRIPDHFKTQDMCIKAVGVDPWLLKCVPDSFKTQAMCDRAARDYLFSLQFVPDWFVTQQQIDKQYHDDYFYERPEMIEWQEGYKKRKAQKAQIKKELMPIAWHPSRYWDWCRIQDTLWA